MSAQFLLNLFIALLWMLLKDESGPKCSTFLVGFFVGIGIVFLMHRFFGQPFYLRRVLFGNKAYHHFYFRAAAIKLLGA